MYENIINIWFLNLFKNTIGNEWSNPKNVIIISCTLALCNNYLQHYI